MRTLDIGCLWIAPAAGAVWMALLCIPAKYTEQIGRMNNKIWSKAEGLLDEREMFLNVWLIGFVIFLMAYIAYFPGIFGYDAAAQFAMYMGKIAFDSAKQPLFHTLLLGSVVSMGKMLFGSYRVGFAVLIALQGAVISHSMARCFVFLKRKNTPLPVLLAGFIWVVGNPYIQVLNCNITKDVLFGAFFVEFILTFTAVLEKEKCSKADAVQLALTGGAVCLLRNGFVIPFAVLAVVSFLAGVREKKLFAAFIAIIIFVEGFSLTADYAFGIKRGPFREYMSVPIQQLAEVMYLDENGTGRVELTEEERTALKKLLPDEETLLYGFNQSNADSPKAIFDETLLKSDLPGYLKIYLSVGSKNRAVYRDAWIYLVHPYFLMNDNEDRALMLYDFLSLYFEEDELDISATPQYLLFYRQYLDNAVRDDVRWYHEPIIAFLLLGLLMGRIIAEKNNKLFAGSLLAVIYFAGIMMAPVALMRYTYPLMLSMPLFLGMACTIGACGRK